MRRDTIHQSIGLESDCILERLKQLEVRVVIAERSNQALVEETAHIRNDLK